MVIGQYLYDQEREYLLPVFIYRIMIKIDCTVKKRIKRETWKVRNGSCMLTPQSSQINT